MTQQHIPGGDAYDWSVGEDAFPAEHEGLTGDRRTEARLCAVQFLYGIILLRPVDGRAALADFTQSRVRRTKADRKLFQLIAEEGLDGQDRYQAMLAAHLLENWTMDRLDPVHHALLWAAAAELTAHGDVGTGVILNEFINISKGFARQDDVAFINAMLDRLARKLRPPVMGEGQG